MRRVLDGGEDDAEEARSTRAQAFDECLSSVATALVRGNDDDHAVHLSRQRNEIVSRRSRGADDGKVERGEEIGHMLERITLVQRRTADRLGSVRDFDSVTAHEVRTPLTAMRTDLEVLRA